jgi:hypothetical protein
MTTVEVIPMSIEELTKRYTRLSSQFRFYTSLVALMGIGLQFERVKSQGKETAEVKELGHEITVLKAKLTEIEDGMVLLGGMIRWFNKIDVMPVETRLAS